MKNDDNNFFKSVSKEVLKSTWNNDILFISKKLSKSMALTIKKWRIGEGVDDMNTFSWRAIATLFVNKYPDLAAMLDIHEGNQISGIKLCDAAMLKLKETVEQGWN